MGWNDRPVSITVAPSGAEVTRGHNPALPHTPEEIARDAIASAKVGATILHIHVREPDGTPSSRSELFRETVDRVRAGSNLIAMVSTGAARALDCGTFFGRFRIDRATGLQVGHEMVLVQWRRGRKLVVWPPPVSKARPLYPRRRSG